MKDQEEKSMRLHAFLASSGIASRRACEEMIRQGRVLVDDHTALVGEKVRGDERITIDGKTFNLATQKRFPIHPSQ
jgi:16S rRNA uridine-516 pseudouridylate synthase and related pseudouridylate synthases